MSSVRGVASARSASIVVLAALVVAIGAGAADTSVLSASASGPAHDTDSPSSTQAASVTRDMGVASTPAEYITTIDTYSRAGVFGREQGIAVANLTVTPGQYTVGYSYDARLDSAYAPGTLTCGLIDSNGVEHFIDADPLPVSSSTGWRQHQAATTFNLGDVTLGIRCVPEAVGLYRASFRDVSLWAVRMPFPSSPRG